MEDLKKQLDDEMFNPTKVYTTPWKPNYDRVRDLEKKINILKNTERELAWTNLQLEKDIGKLAEFIAKEINTFIDKKSTFHSTGMRINLKTGSLFICGNRKTFATVLTCKWSDVTNVFINDPCCNKGPCCGPAMVDK